jgi:tRNA1(Val) A37 N6-methylase TrmN6
VRVAVLDVAAPARAFVGIGIEPASSARVLMNPPFNDSARLNQSPDPARRRAHVAGDDTLSQWIRCASSLLAPSGTLTMIWRADRLADVLAAVGQDFGGIAVLPVYPRPNAAAIRILLRAARGSRAPLELMPGLTLNDADGRPSDAAEALLRGGDALQWERD